MAETVLVTTHDLPLAGKLRTGFRGGGYRVELFTSGEDPAHVDEPVLLVLTGGEGTAAGARLADRAAELGMPVFAVLDRGGEEAPAPGVTVSFRAPANPDEIVLVGRRAIERGRLREATGIVGETDAMMEVLERVVQIAPVDATVLISGESGTGKELVARGIHALSRRRHKAFIPVNVAALSDTLLESELFGHEKGAFTGAIDSRKGLFELAHGGTIFLDEIGEMPPQTQTKLLRIIEQQEFHRVGGQKLIRVNVRILAATNQELPHLVVSGDFRKDLYYRLNVLTIALPPLRRRRDDIPRLVAAFIRDASERHDRGPFRGISRDAMEILMRHRWPGNVRELRNLIESMVVLAPGREIRAEDIPHDVRSGKDPMALVPIGRARAVRPQLEFIFRTMMELKVDIEDLRGEFEAFRAEEERVPVLISPPVDSAARNREVAIGRAATFVEEPPAPTEIVYDRRPAGPTASPEVRPAESESHAEPERAASSEVGPVPDPAAEPESESATVPTLLPGAVAYLPGMTLDDVEREVIRTVLDAVEWNRRQAAEMLGIGERTLYRKVRTYGLEEERQGDA